MTNTPEELKKRTKQFSLRVIRLTRALPRNAEGKVIGNQLLRSATAVGANYRAACLARSTAEFLAKLGVVLEEADESAYWLELIAEGGLLPERRLANLLKEATELAAIIAASRITAGKNARSAAAGSR